MKGYFAFWKYDGWPPWLGGRILHMRPNGMVITENYGPGCSFKPVKILPPEAGKKLLKELNDLAAQYRKAEDKLRDEWLKKAEDLMEKEFE